MPNWSFITNHGAILAIIARSEEITGREMATRLGVTEGSVLRIIRDLEAAGYLTRKKNGRQNSYEIKHGLPIGLPDNRVIAVGDLLRALSGHEQDEQPFAEDAPPRVGS